MKLRRRRHSMDVGVNVPAKVPIGDGVVHSAPRALQRSARARMPLEAWKLLAFFVLGSLGYSQHAKLYCSGHEHSLPTSSKILRSFPCNAGGMERVGFLLRNILHVYHDMLNMGPRDGWVSGQVAMMALLSVTVLVVPKHLYYAVITPWYSQFYRLLPLVYLLAASYYGVAPSAVGHWYLAQHPLMGIFTNVLFPVYFVSECVYGVVSAAVITAIWRRFQWLAAQQTQLAAAAASVAAAGFCAGAGDTADPTTAATAAAAAATVRNTSPGGSSDYHLGNSLAYQLCLFAACTTASLLLEWKRGPPGGGAGVGGCGLWQRRRRFEATRVAAQEDSGSAATSIGGNSSGTAGAASAKCAGGFGGSSSSGGGVFADAGASTGDAAGGGSKADAGAGARVTLLSEGTVPAGVAAAAEAAVAAAPPALATGFGSSNSGGGGDGGALARAGCLRAAEESGGGVAAAAAKNVSKDGRGAGQDELEPAASAQADSVPAAVQSAAPSSVAGDGPQAHQADGAGPVGPSFIVVSLLPSANRGPGPSIPAGPTSGEDGAVVLRNSDGGGGSGGDGSSGGEEGRVSSGSTPDVTRVDQRRMIMAAAAQSSQAVDGGGTDSGVAAAAAATAAGAEEGGEGTMSVSSTSPAVSRDPVPGGAAGALYTALQYGTTVLPHPPYMYDTTGGVPNAIGMYGTGGAGVADAGGLGGLSEEHLMANAASAQWIERLQALARRRRNSGSADGAALAAAAAAGIAVQQARRPVYVPCVRLMTTHIKIQGAQPDQLAPGYCQRLEDVASAQGQLLLGVYVRQGCIELVLDSMDWSGSGSRPDEEAVPGEAEPPSLPRGPAGRDGGGSAALTPALQLPLPSQEPGGRRPTEAAEAARDRREGSEPPAYRRTGGSRGGGVNTGPVDAGGGDSADRTGGVGGSVPGLSLVYGNGSNHTGGQGGADLDLDLGAVIRALQLSYADGSSETANDLASDVELYGDLEYGSAGRGLRDGSCGGGGAASSNLGSGPSSKETAAGSMGSGGGGGGVLRRGVEFAATPLAPLPGFQTAATVSSPPMVAAVNPGVLAQAQTQVLRPATTPLAPPPLPLLSNATSPLSAFTTAASPAAASSISRQALILGGPRNPLAPGIMSVVPRVFAVQRSTTTDPTSHCVAPAASAAGVQQPLQPSTAGVGGGSYCRRFVAYVRRQGPLPQQSQPQQQQQAPAVVAPALAPTAPSGPAPRVQAQLPPQTQVPGSLRMQGSQPAPAPQPVAGLAPGLVASAGRPSFPAPAEMTMRSRGEYLPVRAVRTAVLLSAAAATAPGGAAGTGAAASTTGGAIDAGSYLGLGSEDGIMGGEQLASSDGDEDYPVWGGEGMAAQIGFQERHHAAADQADHGTTPYVDSAASTTWYESYIMELLLPPQGPGLVLADVRPAIVPTAGSTAVAAEHAPVVPNAVPRAVPLVAMSDPRVAEEVQAAVERWEASPTELDDLLLDLGTWGHHVATQQAAAAAAAMDAAASVAAAAAPGGGFRPAVDARLSDLGLHLLSFAEACGWQATAAMLRNELAMFGVMSADPRVAIVEEQQRFQDQLARAPTTTAAAALPSNGTGSTSVIPAAAPCTAIGGAATATTNPAMFQQGGVLLASCAVAPTVPSAVATPSHEAAYCASLPGTGSGSGSGATNAAGAFGVSSLGLRQRGARGSGPEQQQQPQQQPIRPGLAGMAAVATAVPAAEDGKTDRPKMASQASAAAIVAAVRDGHGEELHKLKTAQLEKGKEGKEPPPHQQQQQEADEAAAFQTYKAACISANIWIIQVLDVVSMVVLLFRGRHDDLLAPSNLLTLLACSIGTLTAVARAVLPYDGWVRLAEATKIPRHAVYCATKFLIGVAGLPAPPGIQAYELGAPVFVFEALVVPWSCVLSPLAAALVGAVKVPLYMALWYRLALPLQQPPSTSLGPLVPQQSPSQRPPVQPQQAPSVALFTSLSLPHRLLRALAVSGLSVTVTLACHAYIKASFQRAQRRARRRREAAQRQQREGQQQEKGGKEKETGLSTLVGQGAEAVDVAAGQASEVFGKGGKGE